MSILTYALQVFRYFNTNNVPSSGNHEPVKSEIQALFGLIDSSYNDLAIAITAAGENVIVVPVLNNVSELSLSYPAGTLAFAMSGNAAGIYLKSGGSGSGSWTLTNLSLTSQLVAALQSAIAAEESARIAADNALQDAISAEAQERKDADTDILVQSPNEERAGDAPLYFTNNLTGGDPADVARNLPGPVVSNADGYSVRITGAGTLSVRTLYPVEAGRTYVVRYAVRRIANSPDPANDSVRCALAWYNQDRSALGGTPISVVQDLNDLTTGSGRVVVTAYVSMAAGDEIDVVAPANTRYVRPFVETFGTTCQTDIEVISWSDVTDAVIYSPDVSDLVSRVGALESIDAGPRLDIIEAELNSPGVLGFRTVFDVAAYDVPVSVTAIVVSGYYAPGDGGSAFYKRASGEPTHGGKVRSSDGTWWEITGNELLIQAFGAVGDGVTDDFPAFDGALEYFHQRPEGGTILLPLRTYAINGRLKTGANTKLFGLVGQAKLLRLSPEWFIGNSRGYDTSSVIPAYGGHGNVHFENLIIDPNIAVQTVGLTHLAIGFCDGLTVRNVTFLDGKTGHMIDLSASRNIIVDRCKFLGYNTASKPVDTSEAIQLDHSNGGSFPYFGTVTRHQVYNMVVKDCYFGANPENTDPAFGPVSVGVGSHGTIHDQFTRDIKITKCTFDGCVYSGIRMFKWGKTAIRDNIFINCETGIRLSGTAYDTANAQDIDGNDTELSQGGRQITIDSNQFYNSGVRDIYFLNFVQNPGEPVARHKDIVVCNNTIDVSGTDESVLAYSVDGFMCYGNSIKDGVTGIRLRNTINWNVFGNNIDDCSSYHITADSGSNVGNINGNTVSNSGDISVYITGSTLINVNDNIIINPCLVNATGFAIRLTAGASDCAVNDNRIMETATIAKTGPDISITNTCDRCHVSGNSSNTGDPLVSYAASTGSVDIRGGTGSPESVITAPVGSTYGRIDGGASTSFYVKESDNGAATGWVAK